MPDQRTLNVSGRPLFWQRGFSLVELMVSITIGLLIMAVVSEAYVVATGTQRSQSDKSRIQESMRFAFDSLAYAIRKAGYRNPAATGPSVENFCGAGGKLRLVGKNDATTLDPATTDLSGISTAILNKSDVLRVRYHGDGQTVSPFTADGSVTDCLGNSVKANTIVEDTFFVRADSDNDNEPSLFCYTTNASATGSVAIIPGVESLQLLYGEDTNADGTVERFVPQSAVGSMNNVRSVVISIVARSSSATGVDGSAQTFTHFEAGYTGSGDSGSTFTAPADRRIREISGTTVALKNTCLM
jgi:type IV pilus assembly protein PilW